MADFNYVMPSGTRLYKGDKTDSLKGNCFTASKPAWFAEQKNIASAYGPILHTFRVKRDLKLINISSPLFHMDYIGKVNLLYRSNSSNEEKCLALMPLGLPTTKEARRNLAALGIDERQSNFNDNDDYINRCVSYFNDKHRMSIIINGTSMDSYFMKAITQIYGEQYDGYIQPIQAPTALFGGKFNHEEIGLFRPCLDVELDISTVQLGGGTVKKNKIKKTEKSSVYRVGNTVHIDDSSIDVTWLETYSKTGKMPQDRILKIPAYLK